MVCTHIKTLPAPVVSQDELVMVALLLKRASLSRPSGEWNDDDFDVLADGVVVGGILKVSATLAFGQQGPHADARLCGRPPVRPP
jgi:hypothetical protein